VINYNCRALVASVPFFTNAESSFVSEVVTKLKYEVFQPGQFNNLKRQCRKKGFDFAQPSRVVSEVVTKLTYEVLQTR
jgi:hypothetical protein